MGRSAVAEVLASLCKQHAASQHWHHRSRQEALICVASVNWRRGFCREPLRQSSAGHLADLRKHGESDQTSSGLLNQISALGQ